MKPLLLLASATAAATAVLAWSAAFFGADSVAFAFVVVWAPMAWLGTISRIIQPRVPAGLHELRRFERSGRLYEALGVKVAKGLLRRGPLAAFNPDLHLPREPTRESLAHLDRRMRDAEAGHFILLITMTVVAAHAAARGWWASAVWTMVFNVLMNGYPVILQRYNRALLRHRFPNRAEGGRE